MLQTQTNSHSCVIFVLLGLDSNKRKKNYFKFQICVQTNKYKKVKMGCCRCCSTDAASCSMSHDNPDLFDRSQWCPTGRVSIWYALYRLLIAVIFVGGIAAHMANSLLGAKWFIYMTDQGIFILTIHYVIDSILVLSRLFWEMSNKNPNKTYHQSGSINWMYKISWALNCCFFTIALWISLVYWSVLHKFVVENNLMKNDLAKGLNVFLHAINTVSCLLDIFISARPWRLFHFHYAIIFGLYYTIFSVIYWAAGGTGICREISPGVQDCDPYIYPILNWEDSPGMAIGVIFGGCLVIPLLHFFWLGLARLRNKIYKWTLPAEERNELHNQKRFIQTTEI